MVQEDSTSLHSGLILIGLFNEFQVLFAFRKRFKA